MKTLRYVAPDIPEEAVARLTGNSLFASSGFAEVWETRGGQRAVWVIEDNGTPIAVLPGVEFGRGPTRRFLAMPDGLYAHPGVAPEFESERVALVAGLCTAIADDGYAKVFLYDFHDEIPVDPRYDVQALETTVVDVSAPDWEPPDRKLVSEIRKARREGVELIRFDWNVHQEKFLKLVESTACLHDSKPRYEESFFEALAELASRDERIRWRWCEYEDRPVASHIYFVEGTMLLGWQMFYDKEFSFLKANHRMIYETCKEAMAEGITTLNLGASPPDAAGTDFFKQRWGGERYRYNGYIFKKGLGRLL